MINAVTLFVLFGISVCIALSAYRAFIGPAIPDRVIALDNITTNIVAAIVVFAIREEQAMYIDAALVITLLSFLTTVSLAKYLLSGTVIDGTAY